uniref:Uncharacterized protein n=1 Tax=Salix viminalis TaxID=40686 RepID=A0A6N2K9X1_SALVM
MEVTSSLKPKCVQFNFTSAASFVLRSTNTKVKSQKWPSGVLLKGWSMPQKQWEEWLDCLTKDHGSISNQSATCDAIISSRNARMQANSSPSVQTIRQQNSYLSSAQNLKKCSMRPKAVALLSQSLLQMQTANRVKKMTFQFHWL